MSSYAPTRILVVEDEPDMQNLVRLYFEKEGYAVTTVGDGVEALNRLSSDFDLVILDLMLPKMSGLDLLREIRKTHYIPVLILTALSAELDKILGFELGADDYLTKPFSPRELTARVKALLRRVELIRNDESKRRITLGGVTLDQKSREATVRNIRIDLTPKEFDLLWFMFSHPGEAFSREQLLEQVWGYDYFGETRTVDALIKRLRKKIEMNPEEPDLLVTVWGVGYKVESRPQADALGPQAGAGASKREAGQKSC